MTMQDQITALHAAWCESSGQLPEDVKLRLTERIWYELARAEVTPQDIRSVVAHLLRQNRKNAGGGRQFRINVSRVCGDVENFSSILGEARAVERNRRPPATPRETVLAQQRPVADPEAARAQAGEQFAKLRDILQKAAGE
jgi:hypothetical protein